MNAHDLHATFRRRGFVQQPDGSYAKADPGLARTRPQLQKQETSPRPGNSDHTPSGQASNALHDRRVPRTVGITFYIADRRKRDLDGMSSTVLDCLVRAGALPDDNRFEVNCLIIRAVDCEQGDERVEIEIV